jgi:hypothetical protein
VPKTLLFSQQEKYDDVQEITDQFTFETTYSGRVLLTIESAIASTGWYYVELLNPTQKVDFTVINDYNTDFIRNFKEHFEDGDIAPYMISFEYYFDAESPDVITLTGPSIDNTVPDDIHIFNGVPGQGVTQQPSTGAGIITADSDTYQLFGIDWYWYAVAAAGAYILLSNKKFRKAVGLK